MDYEKINREERKLIKDCLEGNLLAQQRLFKKYYGFVMAICLRYANDRDDAKEILQESFIKVFRSLNSFKFEGGLKSWMKRIAVNTAIDRFRKTKQEIDKVRIDDKMVFVKHTVQNEQRRSDSMHQSTALRLSYRVQPFCD